MSSIMTSSTVRSRTANLLAFLAALQLITGFRRADAYPSGPPVPTVCSSMTPNHNNTASQTSPAPFTISVRGPNGAACYTPGVPVVVTLAAVGSGTKFAGFMMEARQPVTADASYGTFSSAGNAYVSPYSCFGQTNNSIGHNQDFDATTSSFTWTAPTGFSGNVTLLATVVEEFDEFWVKAVSFNVIQCQSPPASGATTAVGRCSATVAVATVAMAAVLWI